MTDLQLAGFTTPATTDEVSPSGDLFRSLVALRTAVFGARYGGQVLVPNPERQLALATDQPSELRLIELVVDQHLAVRAVLAAYLPLLESVDVAIGQFHVDPDLEHGRASECFELGLSWLEGIAAANRRSVLRVDTQALATGPVPARTGVGGADPTDWDVSSVLARGYELEQVERISVADLSLLTDLDERFAAALDASRGMSWSAGRRPRPNRTDVTCAECRRRCPPTLLRGRWARNRSAGTTTGSLSSRPRGWSAGNRC